ncbi:retrovirus-related Pol polyprotein from transposon 17.6 [Trichonephila clavata]|uniref:Retrovirus-related Pol polyprotein from transposon 17.6 n=1 Tax=Trichonephila clavata TaxID=2740835 RepID=A0A8X6HJT4_TRICU|nr:retrovirus-related Pol polyprotein from transposon 17.6 [Trichonephila clavata]
MFSFVTEQLKKRAPIELVDHFIDSWDAVKNATDPAEKLDHFEAVKKVHRKQNTIKAGERKQFERQPFVSNRVNQISGKSKQANVTNKGSFRNDRFQGNSQTKGDNQREWERPFERKKPIICYFCNEPGHIKPSCPRLTKGNYETVANLNVNSGNEDPFEKFKIKLEINGVERVCLRDSGASIDVCARSWINENDLLGEYVWLKSPLDDVCHCLPLAKIKIKTKGGEFYTKAAIKSNSSADEPYLLGNRTADLIESSEKGVQVINAVVTRSASKEIGTNLPTANSSPTENADQIPPSEIHEEEMLEIPQVDGMKEFCLANVTSSDFRSEQERCPDLQALWEKARSGVDEEFQLMKGKLVRVTRTKRGDEIRQFTVERELAAIIFGLKRLKHYLDGQRFIIETDHNPLKYLNKMGDDNPRLQRWALSLQPFNFEIRHKPGKLHGNADGLSRLE